MKFQSNSIFNGTITANSVADAGTNTDKFLVLNSSGLVTYRTAAELYADLGIGSLPAGYTSTLKHEVKAGETLSKGMAVYVSSADGTNMIVSKASNASEATSSKTMGLLETDLSTNGKGNVITEGLLAGLDTTGATNPGDPVWLGTGGNLLYGLANKPSAPNHLVFIGIVTRINANNGEIFVKVQNGFEMGELHNYAESGVANNDVITWESSTSLYKPKSIATILGYTPADAANIPTRTETVFTATANQTVFTVNYTVGSVEVFYNGSKMAPSEFTATNGTSITLASGIPENTILTVVANGIGGGASKAAFSATAPMAYDSNTGVFSMPAATGSQNGYLTSANWTTFNNKQNALTLTVTGSSGAATLTGATLNIPTYTLAGLGGQAALNGTGFVKISGTTISYDNSSYYLTSGGAISGTVSVNGSQISSGTFSVRAGGAGGVGWSTGINLGDSSNYTSFIQDAGVSRWRNFGTGGFDYYGSGGGFLMSLSNSGALVANNDVTAYSDARLKTNIEVIPNALEKIMKIDGVTYERIDDDSNKRHTGVLAQQVLEVLPEAVLGSEDTIYSVAYGNMGGLFIEAIKELKMENNELRDILKRNNLI